MCKGMPGFSQEGSASFFYSCFTFVSLTIIYYLADSDILKSGRALPLLFVIVTTTLKAQEKFILYLRLVTNRLLLITKVQ